MTKEDYMKLSKERLAELLVEKDNEQKLYYPTYPTYPIIYDQQHYRYDYGPTCISKEEGSKSKPLFKTSDSNPYMD